MNLYLVEDQNFMPYKNLAAEISALNPGAETIPCTSGNVLVLSTEPPALPEECALITGEEDGTRTA